MQNRVLIGFLFLLAGCTPGATENPAATQDHQTQVGGPQPGSGRPSMQDALSQAERAQPIEDEPDYYAALNPGQLGVRYRVRLIPGFPHLYEFLLQNTGSGWQEK